MATQGLTEALSETLSVFESTGEPGEPLTTAEVTEQLDISRRSTYARLERLVDAGHLLTKKAGARGRVWWQPPAAAGGAAGPATGAEGGAAGVGEETAGVTFGRLIDNLPGMVYRCENEAGWPMTYVSEGCAAVSGYEASAIESDEVSWGRDVIHPKDRERVREVVESGIVENGQFALQYRIQTADDEVRWVWERGCAVDGEDADATLLEGVIMDVTDQEESERALTRSDEQFQALVDATEEYAIFMLDREGTVSTWNPGAERIKGYERAEIVGQHFSRFYTPEDREAGVPEQNLERAIEDGQVEDEGWRVRKDGSRFWANVTISAIRDDDGDLRGFAKVTRDMTERHEYEERIERERDLIDRLFETSPVGVAVFGANRTIERVNERLGAYLDGPIDEGETYDPSDLPLYDESGEEIPPSDLPVGRVLKTGEPIYGQEMHFRPAEGESRWLSVNATPFAGEADGVDRVVVTVSDVTHLKEQARQLERQRDEIERELSEVFDRIDDGFYALDENFRFTYLNDRAEALLGRDQADVLGKSVWDVFPDAREGVVWDSIHGAIATQEPTSFETYFEPLEFWVEAHVYPSESGLSVYFRDVTDRKRRERELERYQTVVETMSDGVYIVGEDGRFSMVNDAYAEMTGYTREELLGEHVSLVIDEEIRERAASIQEELIAGEREGARLEAAVQTAEGDEVTAEATFALIESESERHERVGVVRDVTERKRRERALEESRQRYMSLVENFPNGAVGLVDEDLRYVTVGGSPIANSAESASDLEGKHVRSVLPPEMAEVFAPRYEAALHGDESAFEYESGEGYARVQIFPVRDEDGEVFAAMGMSQDVTELKERERELQARVRQQQVVTDLGKRALEATDVDDLMAEAAAEVSRTLGTDYCKVLDLDRDAEELLLRQGVGWHDGIVGDATVSATESESQAAYTLESDEPIVVEDLTTESRFSGPALLRDHDVRSGVSTIIGSPDDPWGILGTHDRSRIEFSEHDVAFVQSVANILGSAIERHEHEAELLWQREQLEALDHLNAVVRDITEAAIDQSTREEIEQVVCEGLADSESYMFAWTGAVDASTDTVKVRTAAGVEGYLDDITISVDPDDPRSGGPTGRALRTGEIQTTQDVLADDRHDPWREHVEQYGFRSSAAIPLVHEGTVYGVLNVYADRPRAFEGEEREVIGQLGEVVGHAIAAVERKRALMSDEVVELEFRITDLLGALGVDGDGGGRVAITDTVPIKDDEYLVYGETTADGRESLEAIVDAVPSWKSVTIQSETGDSKFELRLSEPPVLSTLASMGGSVDEAIIEDGDYRMTFHVSPTADVRSLIDAVTDAYPMAEMLSRRQLTRTDDTDDRVQRVLAEELTDRQRTALRAAYHADFFAWPRETTGEDVADSLDVSPPTFHQHLRKAERKVFDSLLSDGDGFASESA